MHEPFWKISSRHNTKITPHAVRGGRSKQSMVKRTRQHHKNAVGIVSEATKDISDRTGLTAENIGEALLNQFGNVEFKRHTYPFIDTPEKRVLL